MSVRPASSPQPSSVTPTDKQICAYIAEMCTDLGHLARRPSLRTIKYLLDMARLESERAGKDLPD